jgi:hypothetical protein
MNTEIQTPGKEEVEKSRYDSAWKKVIRQLIEDFLEFFFPDIYRAVDFSKKIEFLDKELKEIDPDSNIGDRIADVLAKIHLKDGSIKYICIIIHIEVQDQPRPNFMERMFIYYYRIFDKEKDEKIPIISIAILTDTNENYRPNEYCTQLLGFELRMKIPIVKIIDYQLNKELREKLGASANPMSMVVKAQLKSHEVKKADDNTRFEVTKGLIRQCYKHGYGRDKTKIILNFFDWVIRLPEAFKERIKEEIKKVEEEYKMEYVPIWLREEREVGIKIGEEKGMKIGEEKGKEEKAKETAKNLLEMGIDIDKIAKATGLKKEEVEKLASTTH